MNQTSWIAAFIFIGFIVFVTVKGQLPQYQAAIFGGSSTGQQTVGSQAPENQGAGADATSLLNSIKLP